MDINRRKFIASAATISAISIAGCSDNLEGPEELEAPSYGDEDAELTLELFTDFACSACRRYSESTKPQLDENYVNEGIVRVEHYDFTIPTDDTWTFEVANAARSVQQQAGSEEFWNFFELALERQEEMNRSVIENIAEEVGVDPSQTVDDAEARSYSRAIANNTDYGSSIGVTGTPGIVINEQVAENVSFESISNLIESNR